MKKVQSSNIDSIEYNAEQKTLEVVFKNGHSYKYGGVSQSSYDAFEKAPSLGKYFHSHIADKHTQLHKKKK